MPVDYSAGDGTKVTFTIAKLQDFKDKRDTAIKNGKSSFYWNGHTFDTVFAKYVIQYVEARLRP